MITDASPLASLLHTRPFDIQAQILTMLLYFSLSFWRRVHARRIIIIFHELCESMYGIQRSSLFLYATTLFKLLFFAHLFFPSIPAYQCPGAPFQALNISFAWNYLAKHYYSLLLFLCSISPLLIDTLATPTKNTAFCVQEEKMKNGYVYKSGEENKKKK